MAVHFGFRCLPSVLSILSACCRRGVGLQRSAEGCPFGAGLPQADGDQADDGCELAAVDRVSLTARAELKSVDLFSSIVHCRSRLRGCTGATRIAPGLKKLGKLAPSLPAVRGGMCSQSLVDQTQSPRR